MTSSLGVIRFDKGPVVFNPDDFSLSPPKKYKKSTSYQPITSQLKYKGEKCAVLFPSQNGYGLSEMKTDRGDLQNYSTPYYKICDTEEEKNFQNWIEKFENWMQETIISYAKNEIERSGKNQSVEIIKKDAEKINKSTIKPFFLYPNDENGEPDESKLMRHYLKFKVDNSQELVADVYDFKGNVINPSEIIVRKGDSSKNDSLCKGEYLFCVKFKGAFYGGHGKTDYHVSLQTEGETIFFKKAGKLNPHVLLGDRTEKTLPDSTETSEDSTIEEQDDDVQNAMRKSLNERVQKMNLE